MSSCSVFVFMSLMEFAIVNNYMGPVATKMMKGYSEENLEQDAQTNGRGSKVFVCMHMLSVLCKTVDSMDFDIRPSYFVVVVFFFCSENPSTIGRPYHHNMIHFAMAEKRRYILINFHVSSFRFRLSF